MATLNPTLIRAVRAADYVPFAKVGQPMFIQGNYLEPPEILVNSETPGNILINSETPGNILVNSEGFS